jgi:hypothetical protein
MFEKATRTKVRFETSKGNITIEDLWDLPLVSKTNASSLDDIAKSLNKKLKEGEEESFVTKASAANEALRMKFNLVKHVIDVKIAEQIARHDANEKREKKEKVLSILAQKKEEQLGSKSIEELEAMLDSL